MAQGGQVRHEPPDITDIANTTPAPVDMSKLRYYKGDDDDEENERTDHEPELDDKRSKEPVDIHGTRTNEPEIDDSWKEILEEWKKGRIGETYRKFREEASIYLPKDLSAQIDVIRLEISKWWGREIAVKEFLPLSALVIVGAIYTFVYTASWKYRLAMGFALAYWYEAYWIALFAVITLIPTTIKAIFGNNNSDTKNRNNQTNAIAIAGMALLILVFSGKLSFNWTIAVMMSGSAIVMFASARKAADHSIGGVSMVMNSAALLLVVVVMTAYLYYQHNITEWNACGKLSPVPERYDECVRAYRNVVYKSVMANIRSGTFHPKFGGGTTDDTSWLGNRGWKDVFKTGDFNLIGLFGYILVGAALAIPTITNILGPKYRMAGSAAEAAKTRSKSESELDYKKIKPNFTPSDFFIAGEAAPLYISYVMGAIMLTYEPSLGVILITATMASHVVAYHWFKFFLSTDYAIEGGRSITVQDKMPKDSTAVIGMNIPNYLPYKTSIAIIVVLSLGYGAAGYAFVGWKGLVVCAAPSIVYGTKPQHMGIATIVGFVMTLATLGDFFLVLGAIAGGLYSTRVYSMKITVASKEEVISTFGDRENNTQSTSQ